jgi:hypothetical protein
MPNKMKLLCIALTAVWFANIGLAHSQASDLRISVKANGELAAEIHLKIEGDAATVTVAEETERFNLNEMSWLDEKTNQWITVTQCKEWANQSKARSLKSSGSAPAPFRSFLLWSVDPAFKVENSNGALRLTSGQVDYVIEGEASKTDVDGYFRYAVLNAYKKAITDKKLPPFAELKAIEEMKKLGHIPARISITIPGIPESPAISMDIAKQ